MVLSTVGIIRRNERSPNEEGVCNASHASANSSRGGLDQCHGHGLRPATRGEQQHVATAKSALDANLAKLDDTLKSKSRFVFDKLAPGATEQEIARLRTGLGGAEIECLERWYRWHNGCTDRLTDIMPLGRMLSIDESLKDRNDEESIPFVDDTRKTAIKILDDSCGDGFFLDIASPNPRVFYDMLEDPFPRDYGTLDEFVAYIDSLHAAGLASLNEHAMVSFDLAPYAKLKREYLSHINKTGK